MSYSADEREAILAKVRETLAEAPIETEYEAACRELRELQPIDPLIQLREEARAFKRRQEAAIAQRRAEEAAIIAERQPKSLTRDDVLQIIRAEREREPFTQLMIDSIGELIAEERLLRRRETQEAIDKVLKEQHGEVHHLPVRKINIA